MSSPLLTQSGSAQVSEGDASPRRSSGSSSFVLQRRSTGDSLASFNVNSIPTTRELYEFQIELDYQCLQLAADTDLRSIRYATSDVNSVVGMAVFLSSLLSLVKYPGTFLFQEVQLRALVSCLALLHYHEVEALYPVQWDKLRANISAIFGQVTFQQKATSTLRQAIRYAPNVYLVQLVSQYLSFIRRGDSKLPSVVGPIVKIFFGCIALGIHQYHNAQQILEGLAELSSLWQTPQRKYKALFGLQEYTRLASILSRESSDAPKPENMREAAAIIVFALLEKIGELFTLESCPCLPRLGNQWPRLRRMIGRGPPHLDQGYYVLGLLDCAAQLAALGGPGLYPHGFDEKIKRLVFESTVREYRWKAIEILLSCWHTRTEQSQYLKAEIEAQAQSSLSETLLEETSTIQMLLDQDEEAGLKFRISHPLTLGSSLSLRIKLLSKVPIERLDPLNREASPSTSLAEVNWRESCLSRSKLKATRSFTVPFQREGILGSRTSYDFAGLSHDCHFAFWYDENKVSVFPLEGLRVHSIQDNLSQVLKFGQNYTNGELIFDVVMSQRFLVVATSQRVRIIDILESYKVDAIPYGEWGPGGVACHETESQFIIALGQGQGNSLRSSKGRVIFRKYDIDSRARNLSLCQTLTLLTQDRPKRVSLDANGKLVTCVTTIQNKLLVWELDEHLSAAAERLNFVKNHYTVERYETGIISTSLYVAPSQNRYILATTSPSSERHRNDGEWSFSLPIPSSSTPTTPRLRPPCPLIHNFEQFKDHRALRAGAVSSTHNIFAVMEDSGRISLLPLLAAEEGGVRGVSDEVRILEKWKGTAGGCLKFGPENEGGNLFAVDTKGRGVIVEFERE